VQAVREEGRLGHLRKIGGFAAAAVLSGAVTAQAQVWEQLTGEDLHDAFESQVLEFDDGAVQRFEGNGRTVYHKPSAIDLSGFWWVDTNLLCVALDPAHAADCYKVQKNRHKLELKLEPDKGGTVRLRYRDED
jgi:hypothetical protein